jgi:hypothetical protein
MIHSTLYKVLSSRPEGRAVCGPQRRDRGTIVPFHPNPPSLAAHPNPSFRAERPDLFFRADLWRVGSRSRGIPLLNSGVSTLCALCDLCVSLFFLFLPTSNFQLSTPEPQIP